MADNFQRGNTSGGNPTMAKSIAVAANYHRWLFSEIKKYLHPDAVTLEIGSGHGEYTKLVAGISKKVIATDISHEVVLKISNELSAAGNVEVFAMDGIDPGKIAEPVDNIVVINVLEHIKDDAVFIENCHSVLGSGGRLIIFVPAFPFLFSNIDREAGHFRRYSRKALERLMEDSGFGVVYSHYFNFVGFWGWLVNKYLGSGVDSKSTNLQVVVFDNLIWLFKYAEIFSFFCGQSILIVGERREHTLSI